MSIEQLEQHIAAAFDEFEARLQKMIAECPPRGHRKTDSNGSPCHE